jgi:RimJ/RimL family protein N-acetyltransferase
MTAMPVLLTPRLLIRPFEMADLDAIHQILDVELADANTGVNGVLAHEARRAWLQWSILNVEQLAYLHQPPYGDRAVLLRSSGQLIGSVGFVPCLSPFEQIPYLAPPGDAPISRQEGAPFTTEFGLYYAFSKAYQKQGFATEAARRMVEYAFDALQLKRIVATTTYDNVASMGVMRRIGMRITRNPYPAPFFLQVVGVLENPAFS